MNRNSTYGAVVMKMPRSLDITTLPPDALADVYFWEDVMREIDASKNKCEAVRRLSSQFTGQRIFFLIQPA